MVLERCKLLNILDIGPHSLVATCRKFHGVRADLQTFSLWEKQFPTTFAGHKAFDAIRDASFSVVVIMDEFYRNEPAIYRPVSVCYEP